MNCAACSSASNCTTCNTGFTLSGGLCVSTCNLGFVNIDTTGSAINCQACSVAVTNCLTCVNVVSNVVCTQCQAGSFITTSGSCSSCSTSITNCVLCTSPFVCTSCAATYSLVDSKCTLNNCASGVNYCLACSSTNTSQCTTCATGFNLLNGACTLPTCAATFVASNGICVCPLGTLQSGTSCVGCSDNNCLNCPSMSLCSNCRQGYYPSGASCSACMTNCLICTTLNNCEQCADGFSFVNNTCKSLGKGV
jgi:proprotein convertase subtilisin/kexin type 5